MAKEKHKLTNDQLEKVSGGAPKLETADYKPTTPTAPCICYDCGYTWEAKLQPTHICCLYCGSTYTASYAI